MFWFEVSPSKISSERTKFAESHPEKLEVS